MSRQSSPQPPQPPQPPQLGGGGGGGGGVKTQVQSQLGYGACVQVAGGGQTLAQLLHTQAPQSTVPPHPSGPLPHSPGSQVLGWQQLQVQSGNGVCVYGPGQKAEQLGNWLQSQGPQSILPPHPSSTVPH